MVTFIKSFTLALLLAVLPLPASAYNALEPRKPIISIVGSERCPYNCYAKKDTALLHSNSNFVDPFHPNEIFKEDKSGYVVDIVTKIFEALDHEVVYRVMPSDRAAEKVARGAYTMMLTDDIDSEEARENFIFSKEIIGLNKKKFFTRIDSGWRFAGINSLQSITLGIIKGEKYPKLKDYIEQNQNFSTRIQSVYSDEGIDVNMRKLAKRRIDVIFENEYVVNFHRKAMRMEDAVVPAGEFEATQEKQNLYIAFSRKQDGAEEYAKQFDAGIRELRKSGELAKILREYGVKDWGVKD